MTANIQNIEPAGSWTAKNGPAAGTTFFQFIYTLHTENGPIQGEANHKTPESPFSVGDSVDYEIKGKSPNGDNKLKISRPDQSQGGYQGGGNLRPAQGSAYQKKAPYSQYGQTVGCAAHVVSRMIATGVVPVNQFKAKLLEVTRDIITIEKQVSKAMASAEGQGSTTQAPSAPPQQPAPQYTPPQRQAPPVEPQPPVSIPPEYMDSSELEDEDDVPF